MRDRAKFSAHFKEFTFEKNIFSIKSEATILLFGKDLDLLVKFILCYKVFNKFKSKSFDIWIAGSRFLRKNMCPSLQNVDISVLFLKN